jgi:hypothetical protein
MEDKLLVIVAPCIPPYMAKDVPGLDLSPEGIGMITRAELESARKRAAEMLKRAGIVARQGELERIPKTARRAFYPHPHLTIPRPLPYR